MSRLGKPLFPLQRDGVDVAAVVRLLAVHGAAIAEAARVGIGVDAEVVDHGDLESKWRAECDKLHEEESKPPKAPDKKVRKVARKAAGRR